MDGYTPLRTKTHNKNGNTCGNKSITKKQLNEALF